MATGQPVAQPDFDSPRADPRALSPGALRPASRPASKALRESPAAFRTGVLFGGCLRKNIGLLKTYEGDSWLRWGLFHLPGPSIVSKGHLCSGFSFERHF